MTDRLTDRQTTAQPVNLTALLSFSHSEAH